MYNLYVFCGDKILCIKLWPQNLKQASAQEFLSGGLKLKYTDIQCTDRLYFIRMYYVVRITSTDQFYKKW